VQDTAQATLEALVEIKVSMARIEARQEAFLDQWKQHVLDDKLVADRVYKIESKLYYAAGVVTIIVAAFSFVANFILRKLSA